MASQQEPMLDVQQALPGEGVQEVVELVLGVGDIVLCKGQLCSCKINEGPLFQNDGRMTPGASYKNLTGKLIE